MAIGTVKFFDSAKGFGFIQPEEMHSAYEAADVFLGPSVWSEPFAFSHLEAGAAGLPIIASRRGGTPEFIDHLHNGILMEDPENPVELTDSVDYVLQNQARAKQMGGRARERVLGNHTWKIVADKVREKYMELIKRPAGSAP